MEDSVSRWIGHYIDLEYYANGFSDNVMDMLLYAEGDCDDIILSSDYYNTKGQYGKAAKGIKERTESLMDEIKSYIDGESEGVVSKELDWLLAISGGILAYRQAIMPSKVLFTPFNGRDTVDTFRAKLSSNIVRAYDNALRSGYTFSSPASDIRRAAKQNLSSIERGLKSDLQTMATSFAKTADRIVFMDDADSIQSYVWVATLDGHTCLVCADLNGTRYRNIDNAPSCPVHNLCRCFLYPELNGRIEVPTFQEWIDGQDEETQREVLGKSRYEMYKAGTKVDTFVNSGRLLTLKELGE